MCQALSQVWGSINEQIRHSPHKEMTPLHPYFHLLLLYEYLLYQWTMVPWGSHFVETSVRPYHVGSDSLSQKEVDIPNVHHAWELLNPEPGKEDLEGAPLARKRGNSFLLLIPWEWWAESLVGCQPNGGPYRSSEKPVKEILCVRGPLLGL